MVILQGQPGEWLSLPPDLTRRIKDYRRFLVGGIEDSKDRCNRLCAVTRVAEFFISQAPPMEAVGMDEVLAIDGVDRWILTLKGRGLQPTTIRNYILDVVGFLNHILRFKRTRREAVTIRLSLLKLSKVMRTFRKPIRAHQEALFAASEGAILSALELRNLESALRKAVPEKLELFESRPSHRTASAAAAAIIVLLTATNGTRRGREPPAFPRTTPCLHTRGGLGISFA